MALTEKQVYSNLDLILDHLKKQPLPLVALKSYCKQVIKPEPSDNEITNYIIELKFKEYIINLINDEYSITAKGMVFGGYNKNNCKEKRKTIFKTIESLFLVIGAIGAFWYAKKSYDESLNHEMLQQENKSLMQHIKYQDSIILEKEHQLIMIQSAQRNLQLKLDSLNKPKVH
jgi:hypothetical protein